MEKNEYNKKLLDLQWSEEALKNHLDFEVNKHKRKALFKNLNKIEEERKKLQFKYKLEQELKNE